ncbi:ABC transporter permease [Marinobacterium aestuariivivens]|uniref:ABC transporter permease n=1 Tax=Marinobacterium aestuariivivens TaxID=1698799 RepID=A0ABW2A7J9_9GAMM
MNPNIIPPTSPNLAAPAATEKELLEETAPADAPRRRRRLPSIGGILGLLLVGFWLLMALIGPWVAPYDANGLVSDDVFGPLSLQFPLGTDYLGRDILSRLLNGAPYTLGVALLATSLACLSGVVLGLVAAAAGGWADGAISRCQDALIAIPNKIFALIMVASFGSSVPLLIVMAAIAYMPGSYRIARALAVNVMTMDYVQVARTRVKPCRTSSSSRCCRTCYVRC